MPYNEEDYLQMSGIQHYCFCKRQWALIHLEQTWEDDARTMLGEYFHKNVDNRGSHEKRKDVIISKSIPVSSSVLGLSGVCDVVEFIRDDVGTEIPKIHGRFKILPIEYKVGRKKAGDWDGVQLCAEVMALEESFQTKIEEGAIYYGQEKRRTIFEMTDELRQKTIYLADEMHSLFISGKMPKAEYQPHCGKCSLFDLCMPSGSSGFGIKEYIDSCVRQ